MFEYFRLICIILSLAFFLLCSGCHDSTPNVGGGRYDFSRDIRGSGFVESEVQ